jgi:pimeloyl-ACP methyl ester carboxylesterase
MPKKIPLVLVPGLIANRRMWDWQIDTLDDIADCWVAPLPAMDNLGAIAEEILALAPDQFAVAGWSMGGYLCFEMLKRQPERILKLALMSTTASAETRQMSLRRRLMMRDVRQAGLLETTRKTMPRFLHPARRDDDALIEFLIKQAFEVGPYTMHHHQTAMIKRNDYRHILADIACPTLIVAGDADEVTPVPEHQALAAGISHARLVVIEGAGHMTTVEQPERTARALRSWLTGQTNALAA